eukprot:TRINITY_DN13830_c0_g6_i2.p1 TRINITY_DN13830_c0_g6~~TRINITY_DN13830_c0_g6_i2.p1  ORF type:complete len:211 (+),score=48.68 TRINITY_DN13830_c0_g6_i2:239-871(+)
MMCKLERKFAKFMHRVKLLVEAPEYSCAFIKVIKTSPSILTLDKKEIFKVIQLSNNGKQKWPKGTFIINVHQEPFFKGKLGKIPIMPIEPGAETTATVSIMNPRSQGDYSTRWRVGYKDALRRLRVFGEFIELDFSVTDSSSLSKEEVYERFKSKFGEDVIEKALTLKSLFNGEIEEYLAFVMERKKSPIDQIVENYLDFKEHGGEFLYH